MHEKTCGIIDMPKEWRLMAGLALNKPVDHLIDGIDWKLFQTFTFRNNLSALVTAHAGELLPSQRSNPRLIEIRLQTKMQRQLRQQQMAALASIARAFEQEQIPMLSFKGPLLAIELYGSPELRTSCDLDILVDEPMHDKACACLERMGFVEEDSVWNRTPRRRAYHESHQEEMHRVYSCGGITVELHWRICYRFVEPFSGLWDRREERMLLGQKVCTLGHRDNICYLITHGAGHAYRQLRWLLDIYEFLKKEDFTISALYAEMKARGVGMLLLETLLLLYRLPGFDMPDLLSEDFSMERTPDGLRLRWESGMDQDVSMAEKLVQAACPLILRNSREEGMDGRVYKQLLPTQGQKRMFILTWFDLRSEDLEWVDLPDKWFFLYYLIRPVHFLWRITIGRKKKCS